MTIPVYIRFQENVKTVIVLNTGVCTNDRSFILVWWKENSKIEVSTKT
jgi:hypothetical protein